MHVVPVPQVQPVNGGAVETGPCACDHLRLTHTLDGRKCWGIVPGTRRMVNRHGTTLSTGKRCACQQYVEAE